MKHKRLIPICIELAGIALTGAGIGLELAIGGDVFLVVITTGSCLIAAGGVIWGKFMRQGG